jgi:conjugal transfer pilus assembly protein TraW
MLCFKRIHTPWFQSWACFLCWFSTQTVQAENAWLERSQAIVQAFEKQHQPDWLNGQSEQLEIKRQANQIVATSNTIHSPQALSTDLNQALQINTTNKPLTLLFLSFSLGDAALKSIFEETSGRDDVLLVFRGPKPGQKLPAFMVDLKRVLQGIEPVPNIIIDPSRFQHWSVISVPEMVVEQEGKSRLRVRGVSSLSWLDDQLKSGRQGEIGRLGDVFEIAEIDLLEEIKRRMAAIDWKQTQQQAIARFWDQQRFEVLPTTQEDHERYLDLTVTAPRDLATPSGQLIIRAGQTVNPLDKMPFSLCLKVFDAKVVEQIEIIQQWSCQDKNARVMYLASAMPRQAGWDGLKQLETTLQAPVYLLTADVRQRFQLQHVPAIIEQAGHRLIVRERKTSLHSGEH